MSSDRPVRQRTFASLVCLRSERWRFGHTSLAVAAALALSAPALASPGPTPAPPELPLPTPADQPYPGTISLAVDASDVARRIVQVRESVPVTGSGEMVLLYPQWLPGTHGPQGPIDRLAGLTITAGGRPVSWRRDLASVFAFHVTPPADAKSLDISFQYLSPTSDKVGANEISSTIEVLEWNALVLYPAGYYARRIPVEASLTVPQGWTFATALETAEAAAPSSARFRPVTLNTLIDSPVYAGAYVARVDLDPGGKAPVRLNVFADKASELTIKPEQLAAHRALVRQAYALFGSHHYDHYDFLLSVSDLTDAKGLEHHRSSENGVGTGYFASYDQDAGERTLLPHEYTHSWNGKFRRPADLWTPDFNTPMRDDLLWVYEGQTEYWGEVLSARSGLRSAAQEREALALTMASFADLPGRRWRPLQDTTSDEIINPRRPMSWPSWQRFEDYYDEGALIWLDADTLIRERSGGRRSLDDFARAFFGVNDGDWTTLTYGFDDVVAALNRIEPYDWAGFLRDRLDAVARGAPLDGLKRSGYRLVYNDTPNDILTSMEGGFRSAAGGHFKDFTFSLGVSVGSDGELRDVRWDGPAFRAGLASGDQLVAVDGLPYGDDTLADEIKAAEKTSAPLELIVKTADRFKIVRIDYHGGLRYPHLERDPATPARLDDILAARKDGAASR